MNSQVYASLAYVSNGIGKAPTPAELPCQPPESVPVPGDDIVISYFGKGIADAARYAHAIINDGDQFCPPDPHNVA
jgi:hypothetical protein